MTDKEQRSFLQVLGAVLASFLGVRSKSEHEQDFQHGRARDFILVGLGATLVFILVLWLLVQLVVELAG